MLDMPFMINRLLVLIALLGLSFTAVSPLAAQPKKVELDTLDRYIQKNVDDFKVPGVAVGIIKDGEIIFQKGYGLLTVNTTDSVTPESIFGVASCTKSFTAAGIAILVEEGKLKWEDKVTDYLPGFALSDPYISAQITIRDLLCHRSGLGTFDGDLLWFQTEYDREEVVRRIRHLKVRHGFREEFGYQNVMYIAAGLVIEEASGMSWDEFMKEHFFQPIGMVNTTTSVNDISPGSQTATPHLNGKVIYKGNYDNAGPAASINSNTTDLLKWLNMWLEDGKVGEHHVISHASIRELWSSHTPLSVSSFDEVAGTNFKSYALGWKIYDYSGKKVIEHDGGIPGFISKVCMVPGEKLGIVILANDMGWLNSALNYRILDAFLNDKQRDYGAEFLEYYKRHLKTQADAEEVRDKERKKRTKPTRKFVADYAGLFRDKMYGNARIMENKGKLKLTLLPTKELFTAELEHWQDDTFVFKFKDPFLPRGFLTYQLDDADNIIGFTIDLPNPDFHFDNLEFKKVQ